MTKTFQSKTLIVITIYNSKQFLEDTLKSCINQTKKTNILILDNCSTDGSSAICKQYASNSEFIKYICNPSNLGRVGNWNQALNYFRESNHQYLKIIFPGDLLYDNCIEKIESIFNSNSQIGSIAFAYHLEAPNGKIYTLRNKYCVRDKYLSPSTATALNFTHGGLLGALLCCVYSKKAIGNHCFNEHHLVKSEFDIRISEKYGIYYTVDILGRFVQNTHSSYESSLSSWCDFEFSYVESRELTRLIKSDYFNNAYAQSITQKHILYSIKRQFNHLTLSSLLSLLIAVSSGFLYRLFCDSKKTLVKMLSWSFLQRFK